jgi:hypothetical protein
LASQCGKIIAIVMLSATFLFMPEEQSIQDQAKADKTYDAITTIWNDAFNVLDVWISSWYVQKATLAR